MAVPTRVGYTVIRHSFTSGAQTKTIDIPTGTQAGDRMIVFAEWGGNLPSSSTGGTHWPTGWNNIEHQNHGTRGYTLWDAGQYVSGATLAVTFTAGASSEAVFSLVVLRNAAGLYSSWVKGVWWDRNGLGGGAMTSTTRALGINAPSESLVLSFHGEATNAVETGATSITGATRWFESEPQATASQQIERLYVAYREVESAEATPNVDVIWPNTAQNGAALQIAIPYFVESPSPKVRGSAIYRLNSTLDPAVFDISAVPTGAWMIVSVMCSAAATIITAPAGWSELRPYETTGTRRNFIFGKVKESTDASPANFTQSTANTSSFALLWGTGAGNIASWVIGNTAVRGASGEPSGSRFKNKAPSLTTSGENNLVIAISHEATNAMVQANEITNITSGWSERLWLPQIAPNDRIETIWMGTKEMPTVGSTGDVEFTYISSQDSNGWAMQVSLPPPVEVEIQAPQVIGTPTTYFHGATDTNLTIARPSGVLTGDYIVVAIRSQSGDITTDATSSGFTRLGPAFVASSSTSRFNGLFGRPVTNAGSEPSSYTFSWTNAGGAGYRVVAAAFIVRYVDLANPVAGFNDDYDGEVISGGRQTAAYSLDASVGLALFFGASEFASPNNHVPTATPIGYTPIVTHSTSENTSISRTYMWIGTLDVINTVSSARITWSNGSGIAVQGIALRGLLSEPPDPAGEGFVLANGSGDPVKVYYTTTDGAQTPSDVRPILRGFSSVSEMLATPGFTWAHRGGSTSWPEMSLHAYTQSVVRGYGVLEVSLGRTSDGVWFGLHDQTTDRTSGGTYGNASSQTWAQIQAQQIVVGASGAPRPYMRWEEIVAAYGHTHIIVADPKYALGSYRTEFLNMVNASLGPTRAIIKYSGPGSGAAALSTAAQALGFQTWGFFYAGDASAAQGGNGALQTWGPSWTLIGMEYGASQAIWDEALALGKPVIGHIAPNQTAYNTAITKGASGVQVSGVAVVEPVSWWNTDRVFQLSIIKIGGSGTLIP